MIYLIEYTYICTSMTKNKRLYLYLFLCGILLGLSACKPTESGIDALAYQDTTGGGWGLVSTSDGSVVQEAGAGWKYRPSVVVNRMFTLPDTSGNVQLYTLDSPEPVTQRRFARIGYFFEGVAPAQETLQSPILLIDRKGRTVTSTDRYPQYDIVLMHNFSEGLALMATREGKYGYLDTRGKIAIPPIYDYAYDFAEGMALVGTTNRQGKTAYQVIDRKGNIRFAVQLSHSLLDTRFSEGRLMYRDLETKRCGYLNTRGETVLGLSGNIVEAYRFTEGMAVCHTSTGAGIVDREGKVCISGSYQQAVIAGNDRVCLRGDGRWGFYDKQGQSVSSTRYLAMSTFAYGDKAVALCETNRYALVNKDGETASAGYALIATDSTATREVPQVFLKELSLPPQPHPGVSPDTLPQKSVKPASPAVLPATVKHTSDWRSIGKQNPFYAEAAKVASGKLAVTDAGNRKMILNYVEHLRMSYVTKDIDFLEQLFSERALIVVGTVIRTRPQTENKYLPPEQVKYNIKSKREYLDRLRLVFENNRQIDVRFSDFHIMRHPTQPAIYGVSLRQHYASDHYSDDGYLFLLWDFKDPHAPEIHVRTWQPAMLNDHTSLPEESVFSIRDFNLQ